MFDQYTHIQGGIERERERERESDKKTGKTKSL
jgi:hypothetical protein